MLILKRASKSGPTGEWFSEDYIVFEDTRRIGRILLTHAAPTDRRWFWSITVRVPISIHDRGYAASLEAAMADFKAAWERKP